MAIKKMKKKKILMAMQLQKSDIFCSSERLNIFELRNFCLKLQEKMYDTHNILLRQQSIFYSNPFFKLSIFQLNSKFLIHSA